MTRQCATPGCTTLTFGEICLGCLQRTSTAHREQEPDAELCSADESADSTG
jgi:hypothetical protein